MSTQLRGFFAYPSRPSSTRDAVLGAIERINAGSTAHLRGWEECSVGGKFVVDAICSAIDDAQLFCADLTGVNPNVMFELGYAIAVGKRVWLVLDPSLAASSQAFEQLRILTTVGYAKYHSSLDIERSFLQEQPWVDLSNTVLRNAIEPQLAVTAEHPLLYMKHRVRTEACVHLSRAVDAAGLGVVVDDPTESRVQTLAWYGRNVFSSLGVLMHLCEPDREGALVHNARYALVAGIAHGMGRPLLMVADQSYEAPLDYRDLLCTYPDARHCAATAANWLADLRAAPHRDDAADSRFAVLKLVTHLRQLQYVHLGEHLAENEAGDLSSYFVETAAFQEALEGRHMLFVGRKGAGKTANLQMVASRLGGDPRNLVCVVRPADYELHGLLRLVSRCRERDEKGYLSQALWKFLLCTEVANAYAREVQDRVASGAAPVMPDSDEDQLIRLLSDRGWIGQDLAVRLERAVDDLTQIGPVDRIDTFRGAISEQLHDGTLLELRALLGRLLSSRRRVALLMDNLDKAWDKGVDISALSEVLFGLLSAARDMEREFGKADRWREPVRLSLTIFLRSDIFARVMREAREPDKLFHCRIVWSDRELLLRVVEERFGAAGGAPEDGPKLWTDVFSPNFGGVEMRGYLARRVLPRPRDIVFLCNAAIAAAVNRKHSRVTEEDVTEAEKQYSQFAFETLQVENGIVTPGLESILYEFLGAPEVLHEDEVLSSLAKAGVATSDQHQALRHLCGLSFLGLEVRNAEFAFVEDEDELQKAEVMARKLVEDRGGERRYRINPPFHAYLEVVPSAAPPLA